MCQKESVGFSGRGQIGASVWGCGNGCCDHGPSKPKMTVDHVIRLIRRRIKKIFARLIPNGDSGGLGRRHCVSSHCGLQQKSRKNWKAHPKQQQPWEGTENEQHLWRVESSLYTVEVLGDIWCTLGLTGFQERFAWCTNFEDEDPWVWPTGPSSSSGDLFLFRFIPTAVKWKSDLQFLFLNYVWFEPKSQSNHLTPYNLEWMS